MFKPTFKTNAKSMPILSRAQIDQIGEGLVRDFKPEAMQEPSEIDIDRFITRYLEMEQDFQYLSHCGIYLGMTVFCDSDRVVVFNPEQECAEYISAKAGTVIIDNSLLVENQEHRYRFTAAHEAAHGVLHAAYFVHNGWENASMVQCRADSYQVTRNTAANRTDAEWIEWQANCLASAILMPRSMVIKAARRAEQNSYSVNAALEAVIRIFNVSNDAAYYRLQDLNLIPQKNKASCY